MNFPVFSQLSREFGFRDGFLETASSSEESCELQYRRRSDPAQSGWDRRLVLPPELPRKSSGVKAAG